MLTLILLHPLNFVKKGCRNFSTKLVYQAIQLKLVLTLYGHKYYIFMIVDCSMRYSSSLIQKLIISIKMLFGVYFLTDYEPQRREEHKERNLNLFVSSVSLWLNLFWLRRSHAMNY